MCNSVVHEYFYHCSSVFNLRDENAVCVCVCVCMCIGGCG